MTHLVYPNFFKGHFSHFISKDDFKILFLQNNWHNQLNRAHFSNLREQRQYHLQTKERKEWVKDSLQLSTQRRTRKHSPSPTPEKTFYHTPCRETRETVLPTCSLKGDTPPSPAKAEKTSLHKETPFPSSQWISEKHTALLSSTEDQDITVRLALGNGFTICLFGSKS